MQTAKNERVLCSKSKRVMARRQKSGSITAPGHKRSGNSVVEINVSMQKKSYMLKISRGLKNKLVNI
jgi:hypothetical protein